MRNISVDKIKSRIFKNFKIKFFCLLLAFVLWLFVASNQSLLGKFPNQIPVKIVNSSSQYQAFLDQDSVQITAMADPSVWKTLIVDSFVASVDIAGYQEGTFELNVNVTSSVANVQVTKVEPAKIFVNIEKVVSKQVNLSPKISGDPADGMTIGAVDLSPEMVEISGPKSSIDAISEANAIINLNGESGSFERSVKVSAVVENSKLLSYVKYSPPEITAKVTIAKGGNNKTVGIKVKTKGSIKDGYYIAKIVSSPTNVDISGQKSVLTGVNYLETDEIDVSNSSDKISGDYNLILPDGVTLQKGVSSKVHVEIDFAENVAAKSIVPVIDPIGLADGLRMVSYSPVDLKIYLSGVPSILTTMNSNLVKIELNLAGKGAGNYSINLTPDMIKVPDGVTVLSILPATLGIVLSN